MLYAKELITENFKNFIKYGYQNAEVIRMMNDTPLLLTYNTNEIQKRLKYYQDRNVLTTLKDHSKYLLISLEFMKHREKYIKTKNKEDLFLSDKEFLIKYRVTRDEILKGGK